MLRKERNISQERLAKELGCSQSFLSLIESGNRFPSLKFLKKVSLYFNIPLKSFMFEVNAEDIPSILIELMVLWRELSNNYPEHKILLQYLEEITGSQFSVWQKIAPSIIERDNKDKSKEFS